MIIDSKYFIAWLKENDYFPIQSYNMMTKLLEEFELEIETSSEKEGNVL